MTRLTRRRVAGRDHWRVWPDRPGSSSLGFAARRGLPHVSHGPKQPPRCDAVLCIFLGLVDVLSDAKNGITEQDNEPCRERERA